MFENLKRILTTPLFAGISEKRFHEITKLGGEYSPLDARSGSVLNYRDAYRGWVYSAVSQIANGVAKLPFHLLNEKDAQMDHEYLKLIDYSLLEGITSFLKLTGTVYIWANTIGGRVRSLHILRTDLVEAEWDKSKSVILRYKYWLNGKTVFFKTTEIIPIINFNP